MTAWSEGDFLERLMGEPRNNSRVPVAGCPDSESLCAFAEDRVRGVVRDAIVAHLDECPACAELHVRLLKFAAVHSTEDDKDWEGAEKRLDDWMRAFLNTQDDALPYNIRSETVGAGRGVTSRWNWLHSGRSRWAVGLAAAVALLAITTILFRHGFQVQHPTQTAVATTEAPATTQSEVAPSHASPEIQPANPIPTTKLPEAGHATEQQDRTEKSLPLPLEHGLSSAASDVSTQREAQRPVQRENQPPLSVPVQSAVPNEVAKNLEPAPQRTSDTVYGGKPATTSQVVADTTQPRRVTQFPTAQPSAPVERGTAMEAAGKLPESIRLEAGTRVWIRLGSLARQPDGSINFQGVLVEPVSQANAIALDRGTEVDGNERDDHGRTSLTVTGIVVRGVRFALRNGAGAARTGAGRGSTVPFDNRQVLETFIEGISVYDETAGVSGQK
jgi:hypothetical protein